MNFYTLKGNPTIVMGGIVTKAELYSALANGSMKGNRIDIMTGDNMGTISFKPINPIDDSSEDALQTTSMFGSEETDIPQPESLLHETINTLMSFSPLEKKILIDPVTSYPKNVWDSFPNDKEFHFSISINDELCFFEETETFIPGWKTTHRCLSFTKYMTDMPLIYNVDLDEFLYLNLTGENYINIPIHKLAFNSGFFDSEWEDLKELSPGYLYGFITFKYDIQKILQEFSVNNESHMDVNQPGFLHKVQEHGWEQLNIEVGTNYTYVAETNPQAAKEFTDYIIKNANEKHSYEYSFFTECFERIAKKNHLSYKMEMVPSGEDLMCRIYDVK